MGLFSNPKKELREALLSIFNSSKMRHIDVVLAGLTEESRGSAKDLDQDIERAAGFARELIAKGKADTARAVLDEWRAKEPPQFVVFRAESTAPGAYRTAAQQAARQLEGAEADAAQAEKRQHWQRVMDEVRRRAGV